MKQIKQIIKWGLILLVVVIVFALLWDIWAMSESWSYFFGYFQSHFNLNIWLIRIISMIFVFVFIFYVLPSIYQLFNPLKSNSKKQISALIIVAFLCTLWFFTYLAEKDNYFDREGKGVVCKAWAGDHYEDVPCDWKFHKKYGTPVIKVTRENIQAFNLKKIQADKNTVFFEPIEGKPIVYYYKNGSEIEFFDSKGRHPQYGEELQPITKEIVDEFLNKGKKENTKPLDNPLINKPEKPKEIFPEDYKIMGYLYVFPKSLGTFVEKPVNVIDNINKQKMYGFNNWRMPTVEELQLICGANDINKRFKSDYYMNNDWNVVVRIGNRFSSPCTIDDGTSGNVILVRTDKN